MRAEAKHLPCHCAKRNPAPPFITAICRADTCPNKPIYSVNIRYATHSTYRIESPENIVVATDFAGSAGTGRLPDIVTMNHAHGTHFTLTPDPAIPHVLRGWGTDSEPARHHLEVGDLLVRNVPTDLYRGGAADGGERQFDLRI